MANTENREESALPAKRKTEGEKGGDGSSKSLKLEPLENLNHTGVNNDDRSESSDGNARGEGNHSEKGPILEEKRAGGEVEEEEEDDEYDEGDEVYVKGKGILKDDKGKGKLIVEEEEEDSGDSSSDDYSSVGVSSESDSDLSSVPSESNSDLSDDLPSRTQRRMAQPGVFIAGDRKDGGDDRP